MSAFRIDLNNKEGKHKFAYVFADDETEAKNKFKKYYEKPCDEILEIKNVW
jgi:hypothetical protein